MSPKAKPIEWRVTINLLDPVGIQAPTAAAAADVAMQRWSDAGHEVKDVNLLIVRRGR